MDSNHDETQHEEVKAASPFKIVLITLGIIFVLGAGLVGGGLYYFFSQLEAVDPEAEDVTVEVEIPMGSSAVRIAEILEEEQLIKNSKLFYYYVRFKDETNFQAGTYTLSPSLTVDEIISKLQEGVQRETVRFTIPEGLTVEETAQRLEEQGVVDAERFLQVVEEGDFSQFSFIEKIPDVEARAYRLEGFLYPETYEVYKGASEEEIIHKLLSQFEKEFLPEWYEALDELGMTLYEAVVLASVIEREAVLAEERPIISGVFHNRINSGWRLEACATVQYVLDKPRERLTLADLEIDSPYNTYVNDGLPPAPIASPRAASIEAALYPEEHDYFFFVVRNDGSKGHHFSRTYEEHLKNDAKSRGNF